MQSVHTLLKLAQLRWTGHVTRMPDEWLPKKVLYGELQEGKRSQGGVAKRNATKTSLKPRLRILIFQLSPGNRLLRNEQSGVASSNKDAFQFEAKRICEAERKRKERKARATGPSSDSAQSEFTCSICNRQYRVKLGSYSHQRTHINA